MHVCLINWVSVIILIVTLYFGLGRERLIKFLRHFSLCGLFSVSCAICSLHGLYLGDLIKCKCEWSLHGLYLGDLIKCKCEWSCSMHVSQLHLVSEAVCCLCLGGLIQCIPGGPQAICSLCSL